MGHDIYAIKDYDEYERFWNSENFDFDDKEIKKFREKSEIASLRRNMWSKTIYKLYEFLKCSEVDGGVSGRGYFVIVSKNVLKETEKKVKNSDFDKIDKKDYLFFIQRCIKYCKSNKKEGVIIYFG